MDDPNTHNVWLLHPVRGRADVYEITSVHNKRSLNVAGGDMGEGATVWTWDDKVGVNPHSLWRLVPVHPSGVPAGIPGEFLRIPQPRLQLSAASDIMGGDTGLANLHSDGRHQALLLSNHATVHHPPLSSWWRRNCGQRRCCRCVESCVPCAVCCG